MCRSFGKLNEPGTMRRAQRWYDNLTPEEDLYGEPYCLGCKDWDVGCALNCGRLAGEELEWLRNHNDERAEEPET